MSNKCNWEGVTVLGQFSSFVLSLSMVVVEQPSNWHILATRFGSPSAFLRTPKVKFHNKLCSPKNNLESSSTYTVRKCGGTKRKPMSLCDTSPASIFNIPAF